MDAAARRESATDMQNSFNAGMFGMTGHAPRPNRQTLEAPKSMQHYRSPMPYVDCRGLAELTHF